MDEAYQLVGCLLPDRCIQLVHGLTSLLLHLLDVLQYFLHVLSFLPLGKGCRLSSLIILIHIIDGQPSLLQLLLLYRLVHLIIYVFLFLFILIIIIPITLLSLNAIRIIQYVVFVILVYIRVFTQIVNLVTQDVLDSGLGRPVRRAQVY